MESSCLDEHTLIRLVDGLLKGQARQAAERHLHQCPLCLKRACWAWDGAAETARIGRPFLIRRIGAYAAAAGLLLALGIIAFHPAGPDSAVSPGSRDLPLVPGEDVVQGASRRLPDGSVLTLGKDARVRLLPPAAGERVHLRIDRGTVEVEAAKGAGLFRVAAAAGEIRVLGTRFTAQAFSVGHSRWEPVPVLAVSVSQGRIALESGSAVQELRAGERGIALAGQPPARLAPGGDWRAILKGWTDKLESTPDGMQPKAGQELEACLLAASLWSGSWEGIDGWDRVARGDRSPAIRDGAAILGRVCGEKEEKGERR